MGAKARVGASCPEAGVPAAATADPGDPTSTPRHPHPTPWAGPRTHYVIHPKTNLGEGPAANLRSRPGEGLAEAAQDGARRLGRNGDDGAGVRPAGRKVVAGGCKVSCRMCEPGILSGLGYSQGKRSCSQNAKINGAVNTPV